jgi:hypothetical protein
MFLASFEDRDWYVYAQLVKVIVVNHFRRNFAESPNQVPRPDFPTL